MAEIVTLQLPETLAQKAKEIAAVTHRRLEDVLLEWIDPRHYRTTYGVITR
jgi:hypothetical protein